MDVISRGNAGAPRYVAAVVDSLLAPIAAVLVAKTIPEGYPVAQGITAVIAWFVYFFAFEAAFGATPAKWFVGLTVRDERGRKCSPAQAAIRTLLRIVEVNPLIGALPAALLIVFTRRKRRLGDILAKTVVVRVDDLKHREAALRTSPRCTACGEPITGGERTCPLCGAEV